MRGPGLKNFEGGLLLALGKVSLSHRRNQRKDVTVEKRKRRSRKLPAIGGKKQTEGETLMSDPPVCCSLPNQLRVVFVKERGRNRAN